MPVPPSMSLISHLPTHNVHDPDLDVPACSIAALASVPVEYVSSSSDGLDPCILDIRMRPGSDLQTFAEGQVVEVMLRLK
jgi:hypothetical protein